MKLEKARTLKLGQGQKIALETRLLCVFLAFCYRRLSLKIFARMLDIACNICATYMC